MVNTLSRRASSRTRRAGGFTDTRAKTTPLFLARWKASTTAARAAGIDVLIASSKHNLQYLIGGYRFFFFEYNDAVAMTGGEVLLKGGRADLLDAFGAVMDVVGVAVAEAPVAGCTTGVPALVVI